MEQKNITRRGGFREGAGRPRTPGSRHTWIVPEDIEQIVSKHGTSFIWDAVRFKMRFDAIQDTQNQRQTKENVYF